MDLAASKLLVHGNEFFSCGGNGMTIQQVHQKSNKFTFLISETKFKSSEKGYGLQIIDSGILIDNSYFAENKEGGLLISGSE